MGQVEKETSGTDASGEPAASSEPVSVTLVRDIVAVVLEVGPEIVEVLGWQPDELVGMASIGLIHPEDQNRAVAMWFEMLESPGQNVSWRGRYRTAEGHWVWVETRNLYDEAAQRVSTSVHRVGGVEASIEDQLRDREELLSRLADALPVGLVQFDAQQQVTFTNDRLHAMLGKTDAATLAALFADVQEQDRGKLEAAFMDLLAEQPVADFEVAVGSEEETTVCSLAVRALKSRYGVVTGGIACVSDVTDRVRLIRGLEQRATTDPLTGCLNRSATWDALARMLKPENIGPGIAVIFVDLDGFKEINDALGHAAGDRVLEETARRLISSIREGDHIGRIGGDEFLVICRNVSNKARARTLGRRFSKALNGTMDTWDEAITLSGSAGVAWTSESVTPESLVARADEAMYARKASREGQQVVPFPDSDDESIPRQGGVA